MKRLFMLLAMVLMLFVFVSSSWAAGSCIITEDFHMGMRYKTVTFEWTSDASAGTVTKDYWISGILIGIDFLCTNTTEPDDNYDVELFDSTGINDLLDDIGDNISQLDANENQDTWYRTPLTRDGYFRVFMNEKITLSITNAGNSKTGTVVLKLRIY